MFYILGVIFTFWSGAWANPWKVFRKKDWFSGLGSGFGVDPSMESPIWDVHWIELIEFYLGIQLWSFGVIYERMATGVTENCCFFTYFSAVFWVFLYEGGSCRKMSRVGSIELIAFYVNPTISTLELPWGPSTVGFREKPGILDVFSNFGRDQSI